MQARDTSLGMHGCSNDRCTAFRRTRRTTGRRVRTWHGASPQGRVCHSVHSLRSCAMKSVICIPGRLKLHFISYITNAGLGKIVQERTRNSMGGSSLRVTHWRNPGRCPHPVGSTDHCAKWTAQTLTCWRQTLGLISKVGWGIFLALE